MVDVPDAESRFDEARRLSRLLIAIAEQAKSDFAEAIAPLDLPVPLARAILQLNEPAPMRDLADHLTCDRSYITNLADQLGERGLVARVPGDDRRVKLLALTEAGVAMREQISTAVAERNVLMRRLSDTERQALAPLLEAVLRPESSAPPT